MNYWRSSKNKTRSTKILKPHARYVTRPPQRTRLSPRSRSANLPFKIDEGYHFSIEQGLQPKILAFPARSLRSKLIATTILMMLPSLWWLNNSNAFYEPTPSSLYQTQVKKLELPRVSRSKFWYTHPKPFQQTQWLHLNLNPNDKLAIIFAKHQLKYSQLEQLRTLPAYGDYFHKRPKPQQLHIQHDEQGNIKTLILILNATEELYVKTIGKQLQAEIRPLNHRTKIVSAHGFVNANLTQAAKQAGLSSSMLQELIQIFRAEVDLSLISEAGDYFSVIYEQYWFENDREEGSILAAEFIHQGRLYRALRYIDENGTVRYYNPQGESLQKVSLLIPVNFTRISSLFGDRRHPILNRYHTHTGVDLAAPWGKPIVAAGDGIVEFVGRKGGYGKTVILKHNPHYQTLYAHMSKYARDLEAGQTVLQGQVIGYVGSTGRATGAHLHYEVQLDGEPQDPLQFTSAPAFTLTEQEYPLFLVQTQPFISKLDTMNTAFLGTLDMPQAEQYPETSTSEAQPADLLTAHSILQQHAMISPTLLQSLEQHKN